MFKKMVLNTVNLHYSSQIKLHTNHRFFLSEFCHLFHSAVTMSQNPKQKITAFLCCLSVCLLSMEV